MDETKSCEYERTRMTQILHTTTRQLGEEERFKRLNERYLPITSREDHPDYAGQPNPHLDRVLEEWESKEEEKSSSKRISCSRCVFMRSLAIAGVNDRGSGGGVHVSRMAILVGSSMVPNIEDDASGSGSPRVPGVAK
ncbi:hypothetical protein MRX96_017167 [Rhipicephalus microplus]